MRPQIKSMLAFIGFVWVLAQRANNRRPVRSGYSGDFGSCAGLLILALSMISAPLSAAGESLTLREAFRDHFPVGTAINRSHATGHSVGWRSLEQVGREIALIKAQFNQITAENDMKWQHIHPREGVDGYDFGPADAFVDFGEKHGLQLVGHTLVWHKQTPDWVFAGTIPPPGSANPTVKVAPGHFKPRKVNKLSRAANICDGVSCPGRRCRSMRLLTGC